MNSRYTKRRGFTLLELLVVMFILVLLAGVVTVVVTKRMEEAKRAKAVADIHVFEQAINVYYLHNKDYPPTLEALRTKPTGEDLPKWDGPYIEKPIPDDPWGNPYVYNPKGEHNTDSFDLFSKGADGAEGGEGKNADINNWETDSQ